MLIQVTDRWKTLHPGGAVGLLDLEIDRATENSAALLKEKLALEKQLRAKFHGLSRAELRSLPVMDAYTQYYKRFKKTYHLLLQLESVCMKQKPIPQVDPLVLAMFMAELKNLLLTAGHDLDKIQDQMTLDAASGEESYQLINGETATCKPGDMVTGDAEGIFCSIIYGQDARTQITPQTSHVLYVVYLPPGIEQAQVENHLQDLTQNVCTAFPNTRVNSHQVLRANPGPMIEN
jgi:DNA/RNA-binding domain of Phe-tRNA-synthetase-like protein